MGNRVYVVVDMVGAQLVTVKNISPVVQYVYLTLL